MVLVVSWDALLPGADYKPVFPAVPCRAAPCRVLWQASLMAMVPAMTGVVVSNVAGRFADGLLARGMPLPTVRKTVQVRGWRGGDLGEEAGRGGCVHGSGPRWR